MNKKLLVILVAAAILLSAGAFATIAYATHSWGVYHWARNSNPFTLKVVDSVTSAWDSYLDTANADWSKSDVLDLTKETGSTKSTERRRCKPVAGKIRACNYTYGNNGWLGLAQIWVSGSHITQAITKVNDTHFNTSTYNTPAWRRLVMCQEIAHDFGLDHQDENFYNPNLGTCMDYTADPDGPPSNEHPNQHDYDQLITIYTHLDAFAARLRGALSAPAFTNDDIDDDIDTSDAKEWGKVIRKSSDGRSSLHERDLGKGNKVFTFVIWAN